MSSALAGAAEAQRRGDRSGALARFKAVLARAPGNAFALNAIGNILLDGGDPGSARDHFVRAIAADASAPELWNNLAKAHRLLRDDAGEKEALEGALTLDQRNFMARLRLAELHERREEYASAQVNWGAVLALAPRDADCPPALKPVLEHARSFLARRMAAFEDTIKAPLASARSAVPPSELRRFDACVDAALGKRRIFANECHGLHYPFLPADEYFERRHFPWMAAIEAQTDAIRAELRSLLAEGAPGLAPYVQQDAGTPENKWSDLDRSSRWSAWFLWKHGVRDDAACARCPVTARAMELVPRSDVPGRSPTVFFSLLEPHTRIPPHTGVTNTRAIVHLPLIVPPNCGFRVGGETREWRVGEAFAFDDTIEHEAWNDSDALRAVLIFDVWNPHLSEEEHALLRTFFAASDASGHNPQLPLA